MKYTPELLDISRPWETIAALDDPEAGGGSKAMILADEALDFPQTEPAEFSKDWLLDYRAAKRFKFSPYIGMCILLDFGDFEKPEITAADLMDRLSPFKEALTDPESGVLMLPARILVKSRKSKAVLTFDAVEYLYSRGVVLLGTDSPSLDRADDTVITDLMQSNKMVWLLNLDFDCGPGGCPEGSYFLYALPLSDIASGLVPVRAYFMALPEG